MDCFLDEIAADTEHSASAAPKFRELTVYQGFKACTPRVVPHGFWDAFNGFEGTTLVPLRAILEKPFEGYDLGGTKQEHLSEGLWGQGFDVEGLGCRVQGNYQI